MKGLPSVVLFLVRHLVARRKLLLSVLEQQFITFAPASSDYGVATQPERTVFRPCMATDHVASSK